MEEGDRAEGGDLDGRPLHPTAGGPGQLDPPYSWRRFLWVGLLVILPAAILGFWLGQASNRSAEVHRLLGAYVALQANRAGERWQVAQQTQASRPWAFQHGWSARALGNSVYFSVGARLWSTAGPWTGAHPLPYPPVALWCARLAPGPNAPGSAPASRLIFVARHQDLYNTTWVVHEAAPTVEPTALGCRLAQP